MISFAKSSLRSRGYKVLTSVIGGRRDDVTFDFPFDDNTDSEYGSLLITIHFLHEEQQIFRHN